MDNGIQLDEIRGIIRRRKGPFFIVFSLITLISAIVALKLPASYLSESTILIESQQIPQDYVKSAITTYVEERLEVISQQIMSRNNLMEIIDQFGLYADERARYSSERIIEKMRDDIKLETISANVMNERTGKESEATIAFNLSYEGDHPETVQKVANKLASLYLEQNLKAREEQVLNTTTFLQQNLAEIEQQIEEIQEKISKFKKDHYGELPENSSINLSTMNQLERQLDQNEAQLLSLRERKIYLEGQLATIEPTTSIKSDNGVSVMTQQERLRYLRSELTSLKAVYSSTHPDIIRIENTIKELEAESDNATDYKDLTTRLEELQNRRSIMLEKVTPQHPDLINLDKEIEILSDQLKKADMENIKKNIASQEPDNPAYINIRTQIDTTEMEIGTLIGEEDEIKSQISMYRRRLERAPVLEIEYNNLTRDYENAKDNYNEIMKKLMEAKVAQGMEETQRGERFTIIDSAQLPQKPYKPNRIAIVVIGLFLALGGGVGIAAFQEGIDDSFKSAKELAGFLQAPVLSVMPVIVSRKERHRETMNWAAALCVIILAIVIIHIYVMPIDILMSKIQRKIMGI